MFEITNEFTPEPHQSRDNYVHIPLSDLQVGQSFEVPHNVIAYGAVKTRCWRYSMHNNVQIRVFRGKTSTRVYRAK